MTERTQRFLLVWLPMGLIVLFEIGVLVPLRGPLIGGTTWGGFAVLAGCGLSFVMALIRFPDPNGKTIPVYLAELGWFALMIAPWILVPGRTGR
jgi:hypothetical protein